MPNYYDYLVEQIMEAIGPGFDNERSARAAASLSEDDMLRYQLQERRKMKKGERGIPGATSLAKFPGLEHQVWAAEAGFLPKGHSWRSLAGESVEDRLRREQAQDRWGQGQRRAVGMERQPSRRHNIGSIFRGRR